MVALLLSQRVSLIGKLHFGLPYPLANISGETPTGIMPVGKRLFGGYREDVFEPLGETYAYF
jgi:hypothetical protein